VTDTDLFVKICGLTTVDDALLAVALGADAVAFNFVPGSKRQIAPVRARDIAARIPAETLTLGVFRNEARERVVDIVHTSGLGGAQLHGDESPEDTAWVADRVPFVIKAMAAGSNQALHAAEFKASVILIDAPNPGSGEVFDWSLADTMPLGLRVLLAGGLDPDNVADAIATVRPWGVDVASGVESEPGRKDPSKMRRFIQNAKAAGELLADTETHPTVDSSGGDGMYDWKDE
jgi:phosphoribosylanthranilate isomerase